MFAKWDYYKRLKDQLKEKEHLYNVALDNLEITLSRINKGVIHGRKEQSCINTIRSVIADLTKASFEYELATYRLHQYLEKGVITYE